MSKNRKSKKIKFSRATSFQTPTLSPTFPQPPSLPPASPNSDNLYAYPVSLIRKDLAKSVILSLIAFAALAILNFYLR